MYRVTQNKEILFGNRPFGSEAFYVGLDSGGLYRLNGTTFQSTGAGIPWWAKVSYVEGKENHIQNRCNEILFILCYRFRFIH